MGWKRCTLAGFASCTATQSPWNLTVMCFALSLPITNVEIGTKERPQAKQHGFVHVLGSGSRAFSAPTVFTFFYEGLNLLIASEVTICVAVSTCGRPAAEFATASKRAAHSFPLCRMVICNYKDSGRPKRHSNVTEFLWKKFGSSTVKRIDAKRYN